LLDAPDPDMALASAERFFAAVSGRSATFALLAENRETLKLLATLFGTSEFLSKILISHPELLESMVSRTYSASVKAREVMDEELSSVLLQADGFEEQLDVLRRYRHEEFLRIGLNDIQGNFSQGNIALQLTCLAEVCLEAAYRIAVAELARFGRPCYEEDGQLKSASMAIIGMGKMGAGSLTTILTWILSLSMTGRG